MSNPYLEAARAREHFIASHRPPHGRLVRGMRMVAIVTAVLTLWALSWAFSYEWLAPTLVGQSGWTP